MGGFEFLSIILYVALIILVVVAIVLLVKMIQILRKVDQVVDDVDKKIQKLNGLFDIVDRTADTLNLISDKFIDGIVSAITLLFRTKKKKKGEDINE